MFTQDNIERTEAQNTFYTPYECAAIVNSWFAEKGIERTLAPQMFYNYTKKGYIEVTEVEGKNYVNAETLMVWWVAYVKKNVFGRKDTLKVPAAPEIA
jgi:hypothetical protein